jgi:hypothetical protein
MPVNSGRFTDSCTEPEKLYCFETSKPDLLALKYENLRRTSKIYVECYGGRAIIPEVVVFCGYNYSNPFIRGQGRDTTRFLLAMR